MILKGIWKDCDFMEKLIKAGTGEIKADLVLKNGNVVDVFNHSVIKADIAVKDGIVVGVGSDYSGEREIDVTDKYVMSGLMDCHLHIESSLLTPSEYAKAVVPKGVTTIVADPHEIVNVCGEDGLAFMLRDSENLPLDIHYMLPSCVPATPFDNAGCVIDSVQTKKLLEKYNLLGLGEMMNYPGVVFTDSDVLGKLECAEIIDGHAPDLSGKQLCGYLCGGIKTDHECTTSQEALEKVGMGMYILIREGTGTKNLEELIKAVTPYNLDRFAFCTDDKHIGEILDEGTIKNCVNKAVTELGFDPVSAIQMATLNGAMAYGLKNKGAIAPNYTADIIVADSLSLDKIELVFKNGELVAKDDKPLFETAKSDISAVTDTVHLKPVTPEQLNLRFNPEIPVISMVKDSLITEAVYADNKDGLMLCANIERHHNTGNIGKAFIKGFNITNGAVAQSIGHDCHNISVIGDNSNDMAVAVNVLGKKGGIAVVKNGEVIYYMPLPVAGIMSDLPAQQVSSAFAEVEKAVAKISDNGNGSVLMVLSFISLLVIPHLKLGDKGLFDVDSFKYL